MRNVVFEFDLCAGVHSSCHILLFSVWENVEYVMLLPE